MKYKNLHTGEIKTHESVKSEYNFDNSCMTEKTFKPFDLWMYDNYFPFE